MAAPKGNRFWELRSKHGRDKIFSSPGLLLEQSCNYFQWCIENPFEKAEAKVVNIGNYQSEVQIVNIPVMRPFTLEGLCSYLGVNAKYFNHLETSLQGKTDELAKDFSNVITHIRETIYNQKFSGAASGFFNSNIIARDLGLSDKKETENKHTIEGAIIDWSEDNTTD